jgi:AraC family transcriptional regulator
MTLTNALPARYVVDRPRQETAAPTPCRDVMAPWQARCIEAYIACNLHSTIRIADLSRVVRFSRWRFKRAFKERFGLTPHQYVIRRRVERAQTLMTISSDPLREISVECGFSDQFHFSNLFHKIVGQRPGAWRRLVNAPVETANAERTGEWRQGDAA